VAAEQPSTRQNARANARPNGQVNNIPTAARGTAPGFTHHEGVAVTFDQYGEMKTFLQRGAERVIAVDVGYGQLAWSLRQDPRVIVLERVNIRGLDRLPSPADLAVIDVSFISLRLVLPRVRDLLSPPGDVISLVKPQFEVGKGAVGKGGVVRDPAQHQQVLEAISDFARGLGYLVAGQMSSPIQGAKGNREFLLYLRRNG